MERKSNGSGIVINICLIFVIFVMDIVFLSTQSLYRASTGFTFARSAINIVLIMALLLAMYKQVHPMAYRITSVIFLVRAAYNIYFISRGITIFFVTLLGLILNILFAIVYMLPLDAPYLALMRPISSHPKRPTTSSLVYMSSPMMIYPQTVSHSLAPPSYAYH